MDRQPRKFVCGLAVLAVSYGGAFSLAGEPTKIGFNREIRPVLADKCFTCHGPDARARKADLRLDMRDEAIKIRQKIQPIVPGEPDKSEIVRRIFADDESDRMPPAKSHLTLSDTQKQLIREWIRQGAQYEAHWSLIPLPDTVTPPTVQNAAWPRSDLDKFVLARLEAEKLMPAPEASRERWLRRVTFDFTGLPPTPNEIDAFLADVSPQAHERVVDRLQASPRYGEKLATSWLDVARYADSFGYQADLDTQAWPYRDWVIEAFNKNIPYDKFVTYQLAGDLLPNASRSQKLATAFCRIHRKTQEGGSVETEFRQDGINDRINTFGTAFLGLTVECARCHDHKYDPITMKDFYSLGAFFNSIDEWGLLHGNGAIQPHPVLYLPTPQQKEELDRRSGAITKAAATLAQTRKDREPAFQLWLAQPHDAVPMPADLAGAYDFEHAFDNKLRNAARPTEPGTIDPSNRFVLARTGNGIRFTGDDPVSVTAGAHHSEDSLSVAFWLNPDEDYPRAVIFHNSKGADPGFNGFELLIDQGKLRWSVVREWPGNCIAIRTLAKLPVQTWTHITVTYDGSSRAAGLNILLNGRPAEAEVVRDKLVKDCGDNGKIDLGERFRDSGLRNGVIDELWIFGRSITPIEALQLCDGHSLVDLLAAKNRTEAQISSLREYFLSAIDEPTRAASASLQKARSGYRQLMDQVREIPVMEEMDQPRPAFILARGAYDAPQAQVSRDTPPSLPPFPNGAPRNRLGLAQWLLLPNHPLTSRVAVNRLWQDFFGRGLVLTAENFGTQGQPPSHPELLDWLARDFVDHDWDIKRFCKQLVLSATYRQDSRVPGETREKDPENVLLARGPERRLGAEELRDNALALAGLLGPEIGGPPVHPYAPEGALGRALNNFLPEYKRDTGAGLYRRSMYTFWRRTTPPPDMLVFDSTTREICTARRQLTLTPLQPLVLLNDPQFVEAARALGERMVREGGDTLDKQLAWAFLEATSRKATPQELAVLRSLYDEQLALFQKNPTDAVKLLKVGDFKNDAKIPADQLAAAATTASALLNLDAAIVLR